MRQFLRLGSVRTSLTLAGCIGIFGCGDGAAGDPAPGSMGQAPPDSMISMGGTGGAPGTVGGGGSTGMPVGNEGGLGGAVIVGNGGMMGSAGSAGSPAVIPPAVVPPVTVDCALAMSAAVTTVAWDDVNDQPPAFYSTPEALSIAENVIYYQNDDRGWPKAIEMTSATAPRDEESTIDNDATTTQIDYLARVYMATGCAEYGDAARAGIGWLLDAQYDNGGWPQIYPDPEGYPAHITYNDNAMVHVLELLRDVSTRDERFAFAEDTLVINAAAAIERGIGVILATQIEIDGIKTGWCAQHDEVTLAPAQARTYELPSISGSEGAALFRFLMTIESPSAEVREAVESAAVWFEAVKLSGIRIERTVDATQPEGEDRVVVQDAAAPPLWARFYELGTNRPIFSSRCEVPECDDDPFFMRRYSLAEIDNERRVGYAWYGNWPAQLLATTYPAWRQRWAQ